MPAPVGFAARAANAVKRLPSSPLSVSLRDSSEPPLMGAMGGYSGGQAEYLRVPMADVGPIKIPDSVTDEQALFLSDIFPPATWRRRTRRSSRATPSLSGAADRSASLPFARR